MLRPHRNGGSTAGRATRVLARLHARTSVAAMAVDSPSVRERRLARELRLLRTAVPLHGKEVAERLGLVGVEGVPDRDRPHRDLPRGPRSAPRAVRRARRPGDVPPPAGPLRPAEGLVGRLRGHAVVRLRQPDPARGRVARPAVLRRAGPARPAADPRVRAAGDPLDLGTTVAGRDRPPHAGVPSPAGRPGGAERGRADAVPRRARRVGPPPHRRRARARTAARRSCAGSSSGSPRSPCGPTSRSRCCRSTPGCRR